MDKNKNSQAARGANTNRQRAEKKSPANATPPASGAPTAAAQPVWSKRTGGRAAAANVRYCAGRDVAARPPADSLLIAADLWTNRAHAVMLARQGILAPAQAAAILRALEDIRQRADKGEFLIPPEAEDVHMAIEQEVTRLAGPGSGGWLHAGRSRNDQTTTDIRLWLREALLDLAADASALARAIATHARGHTETVCPGFTHMQPAMITTWGHVACAWAQALGRDLERIEAALGAADRSPLGAAASFGTSWPIDREMTARLLGFREVQDNSLDCVSSRGEAETQAVFALSLLLNRLSGIGQDLILLSSPPRRWLRLDDQFVTGSSIMPQKRNPDFAEVTRAKASAVAGILAGLLGIGRSAPAGYNRDSQWTKYLVMDAFAEIEGAPAIFQGVFESMAVDARRMREACAEGYMNAAEVAEALAARTRLPFRDCYRVVAEAVAACESAGTLRREALNGVLRRRWKEISGNIQASSGQQDSQASGKLGRAVPATGKSGQNTRVIKGSARVFQFDVPAWKALSDPLALVRGRAQTGSPNPKRVARTLDEIERTLSAAQRRSEARRRHLDRARAALDREAAALLAQE